mgnify:FL=1
MLFSFMIDYIKFQLALAWTFLSKAIFTRGVKQVLFELNSSNIKRSETFSLLL